nr:hypothetical protein [Kibdelosporangium sp. MJ126-NF4]CEL13484.1 hypothetical protein [Kibdelosporangium sp. MJ126-NF4]CTQ99170.1 hypothetical protein [Kibdelosporangium sp. MJ126-NF4]
MPYLVTRVRSALSVEEIARVFYGVLSGTKVEFGKLESGNDPFDQFEVKPDFSVVALSDKNIGSWAVQLYVFDEGADRRTELHSVYHTLLERAISGTKNTYSKSVGEKRAQEVVAALRAADPEVIVV